MLPTLALAADAGGATKPDNAKAAGTGGGEGAAPASSTSNNVGSGTVGAQGAAAASQKAPGNSGPRRAAARCGRHGGRRRRQDQAGKDAIKQNAALYADRQGLGSSETQCRIKRSSGGKP